MHRNFARSQPYTERYSPVFAKTQGYQAVESLPELKSFIAYQPLFQQLYSSAPAKVEKKQQNFAAAAVSILGRRPTNEDRHLVVQHYNIQIFAVFDGHGGDQAATFCQANCYSHIAQCMQSSDSIEVIMRQAIAQLDQSFCKLAKFTTVGTTACLLIFFKGLVFCSNTGDSRCVVGFGSGQVFQSKDHSPANDRKRLLASGAKIVKCQGIDRVDGNLSLSRSIGDQYMKNKGIISDPDVGYVCSIDDFRYAVIACDGLFGVFSTETVCNIINSCIGGRAVPGVPQQRLLEAAVAYFVGDVEYGDQLLGKLVGQRLYKSRACCEIDGIISDQSRRLAYILCRLAYWKGSMDNISVVVVLK